MRQQLEGSHAVASAVARCRPRVIAAYPITPQTHIIEHLARMIADGDLDSEFVSAESEFAAASIVLGAVATGERAFTATASQGLLLMTEVLFNIAGLRLPVVMICANRAVSAPISIFNDHQDSMSLRDAGWIQLYVESNQEAADTVVQAYRIAETCALPVMVCMDGFFLTHTFEPVELPTQEEVDRYLPPLRFPRALNPARPMTLGGGAEPDNYLEYRASQHRALDDAAETIAHASTEYAQVTGRDHGGLFEAYRLADAHTVVVALGSVMGAIKDSVDALRHQGQAVGALRLRCFRPFPSQALVRALAGAQRIVVVEKALSAGAGGILACELRACLQQAGSACPVHGFVGGLGGRDLTVNTLTAVIDAAAKSPAPACRFIDCHETGPLETG